VVLTVAEALRCAAAPNCAPPRERASLINIGGLRIKRFFIVIAIVICVFAIT
jgi:hypothetical protein